MCEAGRIRHHLKHNLWRSECSVVFVGYQGEGTLGRAILEGAEEVKLFGETISVKAEIIRLEGASGHADKNGLIKWVTSFAKKPERVFVVHGDSDVCDYFTALLRDEYNFNAFAPFSGAQFDMADNRILFEGIKEFVKNTNQEAACDEIYEHKRSKPNEAYNELLDAQSRLLNIVHASEGGANKDMRKLAKIINDICDLWEKN